MGTGRALGLHSALPVLVLGTNYVHGYSRPHCGDEDPIFVVACDEPF